MRALTRAMSADVYHCIHNTEEITRLQSVEDMQNDSEAPARVTCLLQTVHKQKLVREASMAQWPSKILLEQIPARIEVCLVVQDGAKRS